MNQHKKKFKVINNSHAHTHTSPYTIKVNATKSAQHLNNTDTVFRKFSFPHLFSRIIVDGYFPIQFVKKKIIHTNFVAFATLHKIYVCTYEKKKKYFLFLLLHFSTLEWHIYKWNIC